MGLSPLLSIGLIILLLVSSCDTLIIPQSTTINGKRLPAASFVLGETKSADVDVEAVKINPLVAGVKISKTVEVFSLVKEMEASGEKITSLCVGEPDFPPPRAVLDAAIKAIENKQTTYTAVSGTASLRAAIAKDLSTRKNVRYDPASEILVGNGAKQCVYQAVFATCGAGDGVLIPAPYWPSYPEMAALAGAVPVVVETRAEDGFLLTPEALRSALEANPKIKAVIFCNPSNPTGGVHSEMRLQELAKVLRDFPSVVVIADEIYERLVYSASPHVCFASIPDMYHRTIVINGFSKAYAMTGMRLGYLAAPARLTKACTTLQSQLTSCAGSISQAAGLAALSKVSEKEMEENVIIMKSKRDFVVKQLRSMDGVNLEVIPDGAFYVLPDVSRFYDGDDTELCIDLLKKKKLALVPGSSFGAPGTIRISYATSMEELKIAMDKLREFLAEC